MKRIIFCLVLLTFVAELYAQNNTASRDYYLKKNKTQKTVGWVMLGGGVAMTAIGIAVGSSQEPSSDDPFGVDPFSGNEGAAIIAVAGLASALGSIPFFISSAKNARRAATISFSTPKVLLPQQNTFVWKIQPALKLNIEL